MRTVAATLGDFRLQWRYGFFLAGAVVGLISIAILRPLFDERFVFLVPAFVLGNLTATTFFFVAGLVMLEKSEGVLEALVVTPLRTGEYLAAKVATLSILGVTESLAIVALVVPDAMHALRWLPLLVGTTGLAAFFVLAGFWSVVRHDSITDFLIPGSGIMIVLSVPLLDSVNAWTSPILYLWPTQPMLVLIKASVAEVGAASLAYALVYGALVLACAALLARSAFARFVVQREGVR